MSTTTTTKRIGRTAATNKVLGQMTGKTTVSALSKAVNDMVVQSGGPDDVAMAKREVVWALNVAEGLGYVKLTKPTDTFVEPISKGAVK